jgi:hypothetical protein
MLINKIKVFASDKLLKSFYTATRFSRSVAKRLKNLLFNTVILSMAP